MHEELKGCVLAKLGPEFFCEPSSRLTPHAPRGTSHPRVAQSSGSDSDTFQWDAPCYAYKFGFIILDNSSPEHICQSCVAAFVHLKVIAKNKGRGRKRVCCGNVSCLSNSSFRRKENKHKTSITPTYNTGKCTVMITVIKKIHSLCKLRSAVQQIATI